VRTLPETVIDLKTKAVMLALQLDRDLYHDTHNAHHAWHAYPFGNQHARLTSELPVTVRSRRISFDETFEDQVRSGV
jgi:hypothetical protein